MPTLRPASITTRREFLRDAAVVAGAIAAAPTLVGIAAHPASAAAATRLDDVVAAAIHPAIGIARVGNSLDSFYFGPEVPGAVPKPADGFKDASGAIARQAARFRIYGYDRHGRVVRELTEADASITWTVSVANTKAAWYDFDTAMDLPFAPRVPRRNPSVIGDARATLAVTPGPRTINGRTREPVPLDGGTFLGQSVGLGQLMVDGHGRLVVLPGVGEAYSPTAAPLTTFSDNDGWTDDVCDGPVHATVRIGDRMLEADPAWVVVTPPNYGPALATGVVTAFDSARTAWETPADLGTVSFAVDILPVLARLVDMQWVNAGYLRSHGWRSDGDYLDPDALEQLADSGRGARRARRDVFATLRDPSERKPDADAEPEMYGDGASLRVPPPPYELLTLTPIQYRAFERWAQGKFVDDRGTQPDTDDVDELPVRKRPAALDRASLEQCLGGAYHPGIELPWTLRVPSMWDTSLSNPGPSDTGRRLRVRSDTVELTDYGPMLTSTATLAVGGPLDGSAPGDLTRWLGTPWHTDAASCRSGYRPQRSPVLPTFWPARLPNHVLTEADYRVVVDRQRPLVERRRAFAARHDWERFVAGPDRRSTLTNMVAGWWKLGMVESRRGPSDGAFPDVLKVESGVGFAAEPPVEYGPDYQPADPAEYRGNLRQ